MFKFWNNLIKVFIFLLCLFKLLFNVVFVKLMVELENKFWKLLELFDIVIVCLKLFKLLIIFWILNLLIVIFFNYV